jgi:hypothetical protein
MARPVKFFLAVSLGIVALLVLALALTSKPAPLPPLPNPNGYDDLVKAIKLVSLPSEDWSTLTPDLYLAMLATSLPALKLARIGLSRECRVPLDYNLINDPSFLHLSDFKRLGQAFVAEGREAALEHRPNDAARSYLDAVRLGQQAPRGGIMIHSLVGLAVEALGVARLEVLVQALDAQQCHTLATELESLEARRETAATVLARESQWARRTGGFRGQLALLLTFKSQRQMKQRFESRLKAQQLRTERLLVALAARAYELEKGQRPKALAELVPAYLKAIPQDPVTGTNLSYWP